MTLALLLASSIAPTPAAANWGKGGVCNGIANPNMHCYAQAAQELDDKYATEGLFNAEDTVNMTVPESPPGYEHFVTNEAWTTFDSNPGIWIETGQVGGELSEHSLNPFGAAYLAKQEFVFNYTDTEIELQKSTWYDYWVADVNPGTGLWCTYWFEPTFREAYEHGPVHCEEGWTRYDGNEIVAGLEAATYFEPEADGNDAVSTATRPHSPFEYFQPWTRSLEIYNEFFPAGTCGRDAPWWNEWPGSLTFGAGSGVCGGKEGELAAATASSLSASGASPQKGANGWAIHADLASGTKIGLDRVRKIVTKRAHGRTGTIDVSEGDVSEAMNALPAETGFTPITRDDEPWLARKAYLVTMHGAFTYGGPRPAKSPAFTGKYLALVIDANTGDIDAEYYGNTAPGAAGPVTDLAEE
jgi:hypothetical protein